MSITAVLTFKNRAYSDIYFTGKLHTLAKFQFKDVQEQNVGFAVV